jgi:hypothetical protein
VELREKIDIHRDNISVTLFATNPTWSGLGLKNGGRTDDKKWVKNRRKGTETEERRGEWQVKKTRTNGK